ncbi:hypothetical protein ACN94_06725 [Gordonia paraffinivorans]|nr:hypothetical protein [Gordonia paraffinivorans]
MTRSAPGRPGHPLDEASDAAETPHLRPVPDAAEPPSHVATGDEECTCHVVCSSPIRTTCAP